jgi:soluble lytic murein transglycosylase-like protein
MTSRRPLVATIAFFALGGIWSGEPQAPDLRIAAIDVAAPPPDRVNAPPAPLPNGTREDVRAHLDRWAHRTGLTAAELDDLAETIVEEARRHDLEPAFVLAVMHVESRYDTYAVSSKHAMGLMQILPSTGAWLAPQVGVEWVGPQTLFDPTQNVRLGVAYLRQLADRYDGDLVAALAAYNWGPGAIDRRLAMGAPLPKEYPDLVLVAYAVGRS